MKDMKTLAQKTKEELIHDLLLCITYEYDRDNDMVCMCEQYYNHPEKRKELEVEMMELLHGRPYRNPYLCYYYYDQSHVLAFEKVLDGFIEDMADTQNPKLTLENVIVQIGELHDLCSGEFIDTWRIPMLQTFLLAVADFAEASEILEKNKRW